MRRPWSLALIIWMAVAVVAAIVGPAGAPAQAEDAPEYVGHKTCKKCHFAQHKSWTKGKLSQAFEALKPGQCDEAKKKAGLDCAKDYTKDPKCLKCHVTAYGKATGYPEVAEGKAWTEEETKRAADLEGVTCEACHGPGSLYSVYKKKNKEYKLAEVEKMGLISPPKADTCAPCHAKECPTMADDYSFDYAQEKDSEAVHKHKKLKYDHK